MDKPVYLGLSILEIRKTLMYECQYNYIKPKYQQNAKLCCIDTDSFIIHIQTEDVYEDITGDVEKIDRLFPTGKKKKVVGLLKDELGGKIMTEFIAFIPKTCSYLMDDGTSDKKAKGTKKCEIKQRLKFNDYRNCLIKSQQRFKSEAHNLYTGELTRLHYVAMVIKDCKLLRELQHIHMDRITAKTCKKVLLRYKK